MLVFLWTDILIWFLFFSIVIIIYMLRNRPDFKMAAKQLYNSKIAIFSGLILLIYIILGLLDSIHFREYLENQNSAGYGDVKSVLDYVSKPWSNVSEKTFAAPFSNTLSVKERMVDATGKLIEVYPLLEHVNNVDIIAILKKIFIMSLVVTILCFYFYNKFKVYKQSRFICLTIYFLSLFLIMVFSLYNQYHILGTDKIGVDIMYITLKSVRTGLIIGTLTTVLMLPLALWFGTVAGYFGGYIDDIIVYIYTTLSSIPGVLLISAFILITQIQIALHPNWFETMAEQADLRLLALCLILGVTSWSGLCRLLRAETLKIKALDYVIAAKTMRVKNFRIILRHIVPNLVHIIIINISIDFSSLVLAEAVLSYIGVGVDPTTMSWGNMINSSRLELSRDPIVWWPILGAFIPMFIFVLALNQFADQLREAFDPRVRMQ